MALLLAVFVVIGFELWASTMTRTLRRAEIGEFPTLCDYVRSGRLMEGDVLRSYQPAVSVEEAAHLERLAVAFDSISTGVFTFPEAVVDPAFSESYDWFFEYARSC